MVQVAVRRFFDFGVAEAETTLFQSGHHWAGCGRLFPVIENIMEYELGLRLSWPELATGFYRELWRGEHDGDVATLALALPSGLDTRALSLRVKEMLRPLARTFMLLQAKPAAMLAVATPETPETLVTSETSETSASKAHDVTEALEASKSMTSAEKSDLAAKLTADSKAVRHAAAAKALCYQAAQALREKLVVFPDAVACKTYMETEQGGLQARTVFIDATMPASRQTGPKSRQICLEPTAEMQRAWASQIKTLPATPVVGHVLVRPGCGACEELNQLLSTTHSHNKKVIVPVAVPQDCMRFLRSGQKRALGPVDDESSGIDFWIRTIGRRCQQHRSSGPSRPDDDDDEEAADGEDDDEAEVNAEAAAARKALDTSFLQMVDPEHMTSAQLDATFGNASGELAGVFFQHSSRISAMARYLPKSEILELKLTEKGMPRRYRKGQVDPSVIASAMQASLNCSSVPIGSNEVVVLMTAGTPEHIVASILCGFSRVLYIAEGQDAAMMNVPTAADEKTHNINYHEPATQSFQTRGRHHAQENPDSLIMRPHETHERPLRRPLTSRPPPFPRYVSPSDDDPNSGVLAAVAIRALARCYSNHMNKTDGLGMLRIPPPADLDLPPMKVYTYVPVTQTIIMRLVAEDVDIKAPKTKGKDKDAKPATGDDQGNKGKPKDNKGKAKDPLPPSLDVKGEAKIEDKGAKRKRADDDDVLDIDDLDDDMDADEEEEEEDDTADALAKLDALETAAIAKKGQKGKKGQPKKKAGGKKGKSSAAKK